MLGRRDNRVPLPSDPRDRIIANILKAVFKGDVNASSDPPPRSLTICTARHCHYPHNGPSNGLYNITGLSFDTLGIETIAAVHESCCNQYSMTICLEKIWNVPNSLFSSSAIKRLHINHAHFTASEIPGRCPPLPSVVTLEVQEALSFVPACYYGRENEHTAPIAQVKYWLRDQEEYGGLSRIGKAATTLEVIVHEYLDVPFATVDYIQSNVLQCLRIQREYNQSYLYHHTEHTRPPVLDDSFQPFFLGMLHLLPSVPPPVLDLKIRVFHRYHYLQETICDGIDDVYSRIYHSSLVQWLENRCSLTGTQATITFDIRFLFFVANDYDPSIFQETCEPYMRKLFAVLDKMEGVKLVIKVSGS
ncbi:hypothetical protein HYPSUDRAFT_36293 [Hypholoma sublateritium FD-334 SS-4]|uniref:Uncharacterized protein n=1 Tax=Hypholoma sublateritium (strain FD-334 SS-4) TaxID=945553 RepID=A0A0D2MRF0_HYPSF|nr:hypothetical protein HYPSUDRAFT_36293 [Hypholoma sublateritium FD-334 SS-4]